MYAVRFLNFFISGIKQEVLRPCYLKQNNWLYFSKNLRNYCSKNSRNLGIKGIKRRKQENEKFSSKCEEVEDDDLSIEDSEYDVLANLSMNVLRNTDFENVLVIQPYEKRNKMESKPNLQLLEAESLIKSLPHWSVSHSLIVPLETLEKKQLFGKGKLEELKILLKQLNSLKRVTRVFISKGTLTFAQKKFLENEFQTSVMDRYSVVIQILRLHAKSRDAKLQVAMAEIPYIWSKYKETNPSTSRKQGFYLNDFQKEILRKRQQKLKLELEKIRSHRKLLRNKRQQKEFPIIAVVGYTNAGKTSLIKSLTNEESMQPRNQLFATLDVTAHAGFLPCKLEVIYIDTVGFMSDIPTGLIECFVATLEDAMLADIIIHVQDLSHDNFIQQKQHVEKTLQVLTSQINQVHNRAISPERIINVGTKIDLIQRMPENLSENLKPVSTKTLTGIPQLLNEIESKILKVTNRKKLTIKVKNGGEQMAWLYKNCAVTDTCADPQDQEFLFMNVIISSTNLEIFKYKLLKNKK
ncbi:putative GTP-binding protein 6 [Condylostylus longicornis]|uniref:putative GTP-binding protein 6 n=1 Tax=Condylostylus longicornis TaxID=2530218 RepID=UPI00244E3696|nr:putative GTP-binding protein 6 [Condylostylus longicornis]